MNDTLPQQEADLQSKFTSYLETLFDKAEGILQKHRHDNPDLYKIIQERKIIKEENKKNKMLASRMPSRAIENANAPALTESIYFKKFKQEQLKTKIAVSHQLIHEQHIATQSLIVPRTQARNVKQEHNNLQDMIDDRADKLSSQIQAWRNVLPILIRRFSKIRSKTR